MHKELLELARKLAADSTEVAVRRAVSTSYYSVFHALAAVLTTEIVHQDAEDNLRAAAYRAWNHAQLGQALVDKLADKELREIGAIFSKIKKARELADYDPRFPFEPAEVSDLIASADKAITRIDSLSSEQRSRLLICAIGRAKRGVE